MTRLDCVIGTAAGMRSGLARAMHHARHRRAFGAELMDQPLMRNVLADLAVEAEAATTVAMRLAGATDRAGAATIGGRAAPAGAGRQQVLGVQARDRRTPRRRWNASAATATSRSPACRGSTARLR